MSKPLQLQFVMSATRSDDLSDRGLEVAVVGRSNVGKSSLINALANRKAARAREQHARPHAAAQPVRAAKVGGAVVDLPGYGYAGRARARARPDGSR